MSMSLSRNLLIKASALRAITTIPSRASSHLKGTEVFVDTTTHTGQKFEENDFQLTRFVGKEKEVNPHWAINLIEEAPPIAVQGRNTHCDGGDGPLGHPRVFINLDQPGNHACMYCGLRFFQQGGHHH